MESHSTDAEVLAWSAIEPSAFAVLYERHHIAVRRYMARRVGSETGEDLASEVFIRAFRGRESCRSEHASALPWLLGVAHHVIADHRRQEQRRLKALQRIAATAPESVEHEDRALSADLVANLRRLPEQDRDALLLVVWGELSYEEAAAALGVPVGTLSSRIARARRALAAAVNRPIPRLALEPKHTPSNA